MVSIRFTQWFVWLCLCGAGICVVNRAQAAITVLPWVPIYRGIEFASGEADTNEVRLQKVFAYRIDLQNAGIELFSTPAGGPLETIGQTTTTFVSSYGVKVGVNANFFSPVSTTPNDPRSLSGLAISRGDIVSALDNRPMLLVTSNNVATIAPSNGSIIPTNYWTAVAGSDRVLINGVVQSYTEGDFAIGNHPRTAVGITQNGRYLVMMVIDGRQPSWSIGAPLTDVGQWLVRFGCYQGLNLDGGGSTAMVKAQSGGTLLINKPSGGIQRVNGNHIGAFTEDIAPVFVNPPLNTTVLVGSNVTLAPLAGGTTPLRYQWQFAGTNIAGATGSSYSINNASPSHSGNYTLIVSNHVGVISGSAMLNVNYALATNAGPGGVIAKSPNTPSHAPNSVVTLTAVPDPGFVFTGWSGDLTGTNNPTSIAMTRHKTVTATFAGFPEEVIVDNPQASFTGTWSSHIVASDKYGTNYRSAPVTSVRTATFRPTIYTPGKYAVYIWYPTEIGRATNAPWTVFFNGGSQLARVNQNQNGGRWNLIAPGRDFLRGTSGYVTLQNTNNASVVADAVKFVYGHAPSINAQPVPVTVTAGQAAAFQVAVGGTPPFGFQWRQNGSVIPAATNSTLSLPNAQSSNAGSYSVVVTNLYGSVTSAAAALTVQVPPSITVQPQSHSVAQATDVTLAVTATGTAPFHYQWYFNGALIPGGTTNALKLINVQTNHAGSYFVRITNVAGATFSSNATLAVGSTPVAPSVTVQPQSRVAIAGESVLFEVRANGTLPLSYQWRFGNTDIAGASASTLLLTHVQPAQAGLYSVRIANNVGSTVSANAQLAVHFSLSTSAELGGRVTRTPAANSYLPGSSVTLSAAADSNFIFTGWGGAVSSTNNPMTFTIQSNSSVVGRFAGAVNDLVVDNPAAELLGTWTIGTSANGKYGADYHFATATLSATATATYRPNITTPGKYNVYVMYPSGSNRASNAPWETVSGGENKLTLVDQMVGGGAWQLISAAHPFERGTNGFVRVANHANNSVVIADAVRWSFIYPPKLVATPSNRVVRVGSNVVFNANATGASPLSYQWFFNDAPVGTGSAYQIGFAQLSDAGRYSVSVSNAGGMVNSETWQLTVVPHPVPLRLASIVSGPNTLRLVAETEMPLSFVIEGSTNLLHWTVLTNFTEVTGVIEWVPAPSGTAAFYRARVTN